jgi:hypothetical protein
MATEKQIEANRFNAQKSTGPKTPEGKANVSMNSLRHGMRARAIVLRTENEGRFQQLCDEFEAEWQPQTTTEMALLEKMAIAQWKLVRAERREAIICDVYTDEKQEAMLEPLAKFQERFERAFFRALRELEKLQKIRRQQASPPAKEASPAVTEPGYPLGPSGSRTPPEPRDPLGPPQPPSDAPDLTYTMSAEHRTPSQPDSVAFRANGGIDAQDVS